MIGLVEKGICRHETLIGGELRPFFLEVKIAAIVVETNDVDTLQILPCPVVAGKFTEMRILGRDVISFVIGLIARNRIVKSSTSLYGQEIRMLG